MPSESPVPNATVESLLEEGPWLKRLARALLRDESAAEDLSQDVMAEALTARPDLSGPRLRGWLRTVARRLAQRSSERARVRQRAERLAARPEAAERAAHDRLQLHRQLADAVHALPEPYRTAVVLRYLDGLPPRAIAQQLGISAAAARQRVSRGVALLRTRLDESTDGGREAWSAALAAFVLPAPSAGLGPAISSSASPTSPALAALVVLMSTKLVLVLAGLGLALGVLLFVQSFDAAADPTMATPADLPRREASVEGTDPATEESGVSAQADTNRVALPSTGPVATGPRVRVLDAAGQSVQDVRAAWIDADAVIHELVVEDGGAARPESSAGCRFFACAPGYGEAFALAGEPGEDVTLELAAAVTLRGRVTENSDAPARPVRLSTRSSDADLRLGSGEWRLRRRLEELQALRKSEPVWTQPDGSFAFEGLRRAWRGSLLLPNSHFVLAANGGTVQGPTIVSVTAEQDVLIETIKLPTVTGRIVWDNDGQPVTGGIDVMVSERASGNDTTIGIGVDPDGRFEVGLPVTEQALRSGNVLRSEVLLHSHLAIHVDSTKGEGLPFVHEVDLQTVSFPHDVGTLRLKRARRLDVLVLDADGATVEGAAIVSAVARTTTGADGEANLAVGNHDALQVLAAGHALHTVTVPVDAGGQRLVVRLRPGYALRILPPADTTSAPGETPPVQLEWKHTPFEGAQLDLSRKLTPLPSRVHRTYHRARKSDVVEQGWSHAKPGAPGSLGLRRPPSDEVLVPGLVAGSAVTVRVVDSLGQPLWTREVIVPMKPGIHDVDMTTSRSGPGALETHESARLRAQLVDASGSPVQGGSVFVRRGDGLGARNCPCDALGRLDVGPLAVGTYGLEARAPGFLPRELPDFALRANAPELRVELEVARSLRVTTVDAAGREIKARSLRLQAEDGWSADVREPGAGGDVFRVVPRRPVVLTAEIGTATWTQPVDGSQERVALELPAHGELLVHMAKLPRLRGKRGVIQVVVTEREGDATATLRRSIKADASGPLELHTDLRPGHYSVATQLEQRIDGDKVTAELDQREITVVAEQKARVDVAVGR